MRRIFGCNHPGPRCRAATLALALFAFFVGLYGLTGSKLQFGYECNTIEQAEALARGTLTARPLLGGIEPYTQDGAMAVAAYLPFTGGKLVLERLGRLPGLRQLAYVFTLPFYTAILLLVFYGLARALYRRPETAAALTLIVGLGTMIWPYAKFGMETWQTLWTLAGVWALVSYARAPRLGPAVWFGVALAGLLQTKVTGPLHAAALGVAAAWVFAGAGLHRERRAWGHALAVGALGAAGLAMMLAANRWRYGGWLWAGRYGFEHETTPYPFLEGLWAVLFSPGKSLFLFNPPLVVGLWFWGRFWRRFPVMRILIVLMLALALFHLRMRPWADETWGPRRLHYLVPLLALPLGCWIEGRMSLRRWVRGLGLAALAVGIWVQVVAVAFDYTALAKALGGTELFAQENTVWDPQLSPLRFNLNLAASDWQRHATGRSLPFVYERHYMPWTAPRPLPPAQVYQLKGLDRVDLWFLQQRADWPDRPFWFVSGASWLAIGLGLLALVSGAWLVACGLRPE